MAKKKSKPPVGRVVERPAIPKALLFRMFVIGALSVSAAAWATYRYYFAPRAPFIPDFGSPAAAPGASGPPVSPTEIPVEVDSD